MAPDKKEEPKAASGEADEAPKTPPQSELLFLLRQNLALIERSVTLLEPRFTARVLRTIPYTRKRIDVWPSVLATAVSEGYSRGMCSQFPQCLLWRNESDVLMFPLLTLTPLFRVPPQARTSECAPGAIRT